jgi:hypothetical protein
MTDTRNSPCCSDQNLCCGTPVPGPPPRRKIWKTILFLLILLIGVAVAAHSLLGKKDACSSQDCCSEPCGE